MPYGERVPFWRWLREVPAVLCHLPEICRNFFGSRTLLADLRPDRMETLLGQAALAAFGGRFNAHRAKIMHVVTVAPNPAIPGSPITVDTLFYKLYTSIAASTPVHGAVTVAVDATYQSPQDPGFPSPHHASAGTAGAVVALPAGCNDGVVNSTLQWLEPPGPPAKTRRIAVVADHTDVVGYFGRTEDESVYGAIHSNAQMDQATFRLFYGDIVRFAF